MKDFYRAFLTPTRIDFENGHMQTLPPTVDAQGRVSYHAEFTQSITSLTQEQREAADPIVKALMKSIIDDILGERR